MKKPKKTTAAKPLSRRAASSRTKPGAKSRKAKPAEKPKKTAVKRVRKVAKASEIVPPGDVKPAVVVEEVKFKVKAKTATEPKSAGKVKAKVKSIGQVKVEVPAEPVVKVRRVATAKAATAAATEAKTLVRAAPLGKAKTVGATGVAIEAKAEALAKPAVKTKRAKAVSKPATEIKPPLVEEALGKVKPKSKIEPVAPAQPLKAAPPVPPKTAPEPVAEVKPKVEVKPLVDVISAVVEPVPKIKPKARSKPKAKAKSAAIPKLKIGTLPVETKPKAEIKMPIQKPVSPITAQETKRAPRPQRKAPGKIPSILFEGDKAEAPAVSGPGQRYALGPTALVEKLQTEGELPESYGTGAILLAARDPHWLYTHWDLSGDQQRRYNGFSRDGHLIVRIYIDAPRGKPVAQVRVHPESRHWFVHVDKANTRYVAELGYYSAADKWTVISTSSATLTPPDAVSAETTAEFATIPFEVPIEKLLSLVKEAVQANAPLAQALQELRAEGHTELPKMEVPSPVAAATRPVQRASQKTISRWTPSEWTPAQERALAQVISMDHVRRVWMGSLEITELIRRQFVNELASITAAELGAQAPGAPTSPTGAVTGISSPISKAAGQPKGFWFNVNAELIVYGATEPDATVSIGGRKIKLRPDGSFSYRFALPDGNYEMPVVAISADETDGRAAEMKFSRGTEYRGDVGAHPQDPSLQQLILENF